jgi:predicted dehydrogenase
MRYDNGALGTIVASSCAPGANPSGIRGTRALGNRIFGTAGQIIFAGAELIVYTDNQVDGLEQGCWTSIPLSKADPYVTYFERFAESALNGSPLDIPGEEGRKTLEVILAIYESGRTHQPVELPL